MKKHFTFFWKGILNPDAKIPFSFGRHKSSTLNHFVLHECALLFGTSDDRNYVLQKFGTEGFKKPMYERFDKDVWRRTLPGTIYTAAINMCAADEKFLNQIMNSDGTLVYANPFDSLLGIGFMPGDEQAKDPATWNGENLLGSVYTVVREVGLTRCV